MSPRTLPVSGGPHATDTRLEKKPVVWPVPSTGWLGPARESSLCLRPAPCEGCPPVPESLYLRPPSNVDSVLSIETPDSKIHMRDPDHCPHAFRDSIKLPMSEQAADKRRHFVFCYCQMDQAIPGMAETTHLKILITGKEGRAA